MALPAYGRTQRRCSDAPDWRPHCIPAARCDSQRRLQNGLVTASQIDRKVNLSGRADGARQPRCSFDLDTARAFSAPRHLDHHVDLSSRIFEQTRPSAKQHPARFGDVPHHLFPSTCPKISSISIGMPNIRGQSCIQASRRVIAGIETKNEIVTGAHPILAPGSANREAT